jgi:hypothetical protein
VSNGLFIVIQPKQRDSPPEGVCERHPKSVG